MDIFLAPLKAIVQALGYTCEIQASPARKEFQDTPLVLLCPGIASPLDVQQLSFCSLNQTRRYDLYLVAQQNFDVTDSGSNVDLYQSLLTALLPKQGNGQRTITAGLAILGAWDLRVYPKLNYDRRLFPVGYSVTAVAVEIDKILS